MILYLVLGILLHFHEFLIEVFDHILNYIFFWFLSSVKYLTVQTKILMLMRISCNALCLQGGATHVDIASDPELVKLAISLTSCPVYS